MATVAPKAGVTHAEVCCALADHLLRLRATGTPKVDGASYSTYSYYPPSLPLPQSLPRPDTPPVVQVQ